jgi:hypothetical protein
MNITKGKWKVNEVRGIRIQTKNKCICLLGDTEEQDEDNANLICSAVNACQEINPDNPMAVAESIKEMYEALKAIEQHQTGTQGHWCPDCWSILEKAIAKAEGK